MLVRRYYSRGSRTLLRIDKYPRAWGWARPNLPLYKQAAGERHHGGYCHTRPEPSTGGWQRKGREDLSPAAGLHRSAGHGTLRLPLDRFLKARALFRVHSDHYRVLQRSGTASQNGCQSRSIDYSNQRAHREESPLPRGEVQDLSECCRLHRTAVHRAHSRLLGHTFSGRRVRIAESARSRGRFTGGLKAAAAGCVQHNLACRLNTLECSRLDKPKDALSESPRCGVLLSAGIRFHTTCATATCRADSAEGRSSVARRR